MFEVYCVTSQFAGSPGPVPYVNLTCIVSLTTKITVTLFTIILTYSPLAAEKSGGTTDRVTADSPYNESRCSSVFNGAKWVFRLLDSLPMKICMIVFMLLRLQLLLRLESVVWLDLAFGLVLQLELVSGLYNWLFHLATVR